MSHVDKKYGFNWSINRSISISIDRTDIYRWDKLLLLLPYQGEWSFQFTDSLKINSKDFYLILLKVNIRFTGKNI